MIRWILPALLAAAAPAAAQDSSHVTIPMPAGRGCFRGGPLPRCRSFWITEAGYTARVTRAEDPSTTANQRNVLASAELGGMRNLSPKFALGASASVGLLSHLYLAVKPRARFWINQSTALDVAPGLTLAGGGGPVRFTADATVMFNDRIGITVQSFVLPVTTYGQNGAVTTRQKLSLYAGLRLASKLGVYGAAADGVALVALIGAFLIACSNNGCD